MQSTRRFFGKGLGMIGLLSALGSTLFTVGCGIVNEIASYVGIGLQAFQSIVDILSGAGVITIGEGSAIDAIVALVKSGFADLAAAVSAYDNAPASAKQSLLGKISTVISIIMAQIQQFWNDLHIPDPRLADTIKGLLGIILATLAGFLTQLPSPGPAAVKANDKVKALPNTLPVKAQVRKMTDFKHDFNSILEQNGFGEHKIY